MALKISQLTPVAAGSLDGSEPVELGIAGDKNAPNGAFLPPGYIDGLKAVWVGPNAITFTNGAAYIPSLGRVVRVGASIAKAGLALAGNTKYYAYLWINGAAADVELSTTAPSAPYNGTARTKTGDASRRYLRMVVTDASGNIYAFKQTGHLIEYMANIYAAPFLVLNGANATTPTDISCAGLVPPTSQSALLTAINQDPGVAVVLGTSDQGYTLAANAFQGFVNNGNSVLGFFNLNSAQVLQYMFRSSPSGTFGMRVQGYLEER